MQGVRLRREFFMIARTTFRGTATVPSDTRFHQSRSSLHRVSDERDGWTVAVAYRIGASAPPHPGSAANLAATERDVKAHFPPREKQPGSPNPEL